MPLKVTGIPHWRHAKLFIFGAGCLAGIVRPAGPSPSIELPQTGKMESVKFHVLADEHERSVFTVIERGERILFSQQIRNRSVVSRTYLKRQLAFATDAMSGLEILHFEPLAFELDFLSHI